MAGGSFPLVSGLTRACPRQTKGLIKMCTQLEFSGLNYGADQPSGRMPMGLFGIQVVALVVACGTYL